MCVLHEESSIWRSLRLSFSLWNLGNCNVAVVAEASVSGGGWKSGDLSPQAVVYSQASGVPNEAPIYGREPQPSFKLSPGPTFTLTVAQASAAPIVGPGVSIKTSSLSTAMPSLCLFPSAEPIVDCSFERVSSQHYRTPSSLLSTVPSIGLKPSSFAT
jgi:hypothetical protein